MAALGWNFTGFADREQAFENIDLFTFNRFDVDFMLNELSNKIKFTAKPNTPIVVDLFKTKFESQDVFGLLRSLIYFEDAEMQQIQYC